MDSSPGDEGLVLRGKRAEFSFAPEFFHGVVCGESKVYAGGVALTIALGLGVRFAPLGVPWVVSKYGGSMLWALAIYWVVAMVLPGSEPRRVGVTAGGGCDGGGVSEAVPDALAGCVSGTMPGVLLLGRYFAWADILAYWWRSGVGRWWTGTCCGGAGRRVDDEWRGKGGPSLRSG